MAQIPGPSATGSGPSSQPPTPRAPVPTTALKSNPWAALTAGILCIIAGVLDFFVGIIVSVVLGVAGSFAGMHGLGGLGLIWIIAGILAVVGGVFSIQRKAWPMALIASICALIWRLSLFGILSIIFVSVGKKEFT